MRTCRPYLFYHYSITIYYWKEKKKDTVEPPQRSTLHDGPFFVSTGKFIPLYNDNGR